MFLQSLAAMGMAAHVGVKPSADLNAGFLASYAVFVPTAAPLCCND